jgi:hypothetical protein
MLLEIMPQFMSDHKVLHKQVVKRILNIYKELKGLKLVTSIVFEMKTKQKG